MTARLNHTIVAARDRDASALFLAEMLGLPPPLELGHFAVVGVGDDLSLDFVESDGDIVAQHYAFLVDETEFDASTMLFIHPDECIDCGACVPACPVEAIYAQDEVPDKWKNYIDVNADHYKK